MHLKLNANQKLISSNCFRLLSLVPEIQNDVEVIKPVLDELEVMRLSHTLGMMSSVNSKDFEMEMLDASEFDDDFILFLRKKIFGTDEKCTTNEVKVICLCGKQDAVAHELKRIKCWSNELDSNLKSEDQGIYCITRKEDKGAETSLILFGWIQDYLFRKSRLRDTATYVLRFLTCLSPHMVCCLSSEDIEQIGQTVVSMNSNNLEAWRSYSVAFKIERQEEEKDAVGCESLPDVLAQSIHNVHLLKGSYPAFRVVEPAQAEKYTEKSHETFIDFHALANWLIDQSKCHNLQLEDESADFRRKLHYELLYRSGRYPEAKLKGIDDMLERSLQSSVEQTKDQVQMSIEERRATLLGYCDNLFDLDVLLMAVKGEPCFVTLHEYLEEIQTYRDIWSQVETAHKETLSLPLRLKNQIKKLASTFRHCRDTEPDCNISELIADFMRDFTVASDTKLPANTEGIVSRTLKRVGKLLWSDELEPPSDEFRECMIVPLNKARQAWFEAVEAVLAIAEKELLTRKNKERRQSMVQSCNQDKEKIITEAFHELQHSWQTQHNEDLTTIVSPRRRGSRIYCDVKKELWKPASQQVKIFKVVRDDDGSFSSTELGAHRLRPDATILAAYTIKNRSVILVTTSPQGTSVERVNFPLQQSYGNKQQGMATSIRSFGRAVPLCDFNVHERLIAFVEEGGRVGLYRFDEAFSSLEIYKKVELSLRTSLVLPVVNCLLVDGFLYATDKVGSIQSVNLKNQQTSRVAQIIPSGTHATSLFAMADNMVLGFMAIKETDDTSEPDQRAVLHAVSSEDFRKLPVNDFQSVSLSSLGASVQCFDNVLFAIDEKEGKICVRQLVVTVRSESFRIKHSQEHSINGSKTESDGSTNDEDHWLRVFYHIYEKFPVRGLIRGVDDSSATLQISLMCSSALTKSAEDNCRNFVQAVMHDLRKLNKPLAGMDLVRDLAFVTEIDVVMNGAASRPVRSFIEELVTFVPIQICRAEGNSLTVMTNGKAASMDTQSKNLQAFDIARSIRFGLLSPLLESWQGRCIVITSMGKQSTGKSYLLNQLTGSSFAIAGARCTDGAWMSIRILPKRILLVILDFEGLGSFERTEQEDVFLSILNASISMFTIFRMEMRFDKEIDDLFARFQKGVALIKGDPSLFRGKLYMSVKDVNPNDQKGVMDEFYAKFQMLVGANRDSNFLVDLYSGQLSINCSPPLGTLSYYQSLGHAQNFIENSLCNSQTAGFPNGKAFLNCIRLVLAKITILDWTSLDESAKQFQLSEITSKLAGLLRTGCIVPQEYVMKNDDINQYLKEDITLVDGTVIDVDLMTMMAEYPSLSDKWSYLDEIIDLDSLSDGEIDLEFDCSSKCEDSIDQVHRSIKKLFQLFLRFNSSVRGGKVSRETVADFDSFLAFIVRRRKARINVWVKQTLGGRVPDEWKLVEQQYFERFQMLLTRCQSKCNNCRLGCMKAATHPGTTAHDCGGSHVCAGRCEYCERSEHSGKTPNCAKEAGHEGKCECADGDHTCGQDCYLGNAPNCGKKCSLKRGHSDLHKCDVPFHMCGSECSALNCSGPCVLNVEHLHTAHKCIEVRCMQKCVMDGCNEMCGVMDHFHGQTDVSVVFSVENSDEKGSNTFDAASDIPVVHMCENEHECQALCQEDGICRVDVFLKQSSKMFTGARGNFQFTFQEMNGSRKKCTKRLPPSQKMHQGPHTCICEANDDDDGDRTIHYCDVRCPCCSYFCNSEFGHFGEHTTSHGNMRNTYFLSDAEDIDIEERKYKAGEMGIAEMCNLYCSKMGREHVHYLDCEQGSKDKCVYSGSATDQRRHCTRELEPKPEKETDEVLHEQFWKTLGWKDPCTSKVELELFGKCAYKCDAPDHDDKPSYCILPAWHKPEPKPSSGFDGCTYVSGHKFECSHVASGGRMHHVFVLDCSGSMSGRPWDDLMAAWKEYIYNRLNDGASLDLVSVVTFDSYAEIVYEARNISTMTKARIYYRGGGTNYAAGLRSANEVLSRMNFDQYKPAIIFFSDGHPCDPLQGEQMAMHIRECYEKNGLQAFAVGFGSINLNMLERVAERLGGVYHHVLTGNELKATFFSISASLSTRVGLALAKPDHERNCVICGQDLASGETVKLDGCRHELHKACLDVLVRNAEQDQEVARCPSCRREFAT